MRQCERRFFEHLYHFLGHLGRSAELTVHQRARVQRVSQLLVLRVLAMQDFNRFEVLLLVKSALLHALSSAGKRVQHVVIN